MTVLKYGVAAAAVTGLVLAASPAHAASAAKKDKADDAPAPTDITKVSVRNTEKAVLVHTKLSKATAERTHLVVTMTPAADDAPTYVVTTTDVVKSGPDKGKGKGQDKDKKDKVRTGAVLESYEPGASEGTVVECDGLKAVLSLGRHGSSLVKVPTACLGEDAGTLTVDVATADGEGETVDELAGALRVKQG